MLGGIQLQLLIGPVPIPAPQEVVQALTSVRVEAGAGETQAGFELTFDLPARSPLRTLFLLTGGGSLPLMRVVLVVQFNGRAESVIDGVTTNVETQPGVGGVGKLVVKGKDMSALMDLIELTGLPYPAMPPAVRVLLVLAKYAAFGVIPLVIPSIVEDLPIPVQRIPQQRGSDYAYVKSLAQQCGYVFYLEPGPVPATSKAYWGPEIRVGEPQPALAVNMDGLTNVEQLNFNFDKERKTLPIVFLQEPISKAPIPIPIPDISPLNPPLGLVPPLPPRIKSLDNTAQMSPLSALITGLAYASQHSDSVFGNGQLDVARYGRLLKSRQLVGVRGAGVPFDGLYFVKSVTHDIKRGEYKQSFSLARNGLVSTFPRGADMSAGPFFGKYRGTVINNVDPLLIGRIQAMVPDVAGFIPSSWAMPCVPVAGINMGVFTVPPIGAGVWIEFERGDPDYPIWVGGYWGSAAETPVLAKSVPPGLAGITLQTTLKNGIVISDTPGPTGGILIQTTTGAMVSVSDVGIIISNGKGAVINMTGPTIDVNLGALTVI